jgi:hypothetical protein
MCFYVLLCFSSGRYYTWAHYKTARWVHIGLDWAWVEFWVYNILAHCAFELQVLDFIEYRAFIFVPTLVYFFVLMSVFQCLFWMEGTSRLIS